eukprot:1160192-Pelagomonas_calceolata.AAC.4
MLSPIKSGICTGKAAHIGTDSADTKLMGMGLQGWPASAVVCFGTNTDKAHSCTHIRPPSNPATPHPHTQAHIRSGRPGSAHTAAMIGADNTHTHTYTHTQTHALTCSGRPRLSTSGCSDSSCSTVGRGSRRKRGWASRACSGMSSPGSLLSLSAMHCRCAWGCTRYCPLDFPFYNAKQRRFIQGSVGARHTGLFP